MNNKIYGYKPLNNTQYSVNGSNVGWDINTDTFDQINNEISLPISNNPGGRFLYDSVEAVVLPQSPQQFTIFTWEGISYVFYKEGYWVKVTLPFTLPAITYTDPPIAVYYYNGGQWMHTGVSGTGWTLSGGVYINLPNRCYTLRYYFQKPRLEDPRKGTHNYTFLTEPIIVPIAEYNNARLLGTITSGEIGSNGINFPDGIASQLKDNDSVMLIPTEVNPNNNIGKTITVFPRMKSRYYYYSTGAGFNPSAGDVENYYLNNGNNTFYFGYNQQFNDAYQTNINKLLMAPTLGWPAITNLVFGSASYSLSSPYGYYFAGKLCRDSNSNLWKYEGANFKQTFGFAKHGRVSNVSQYNTQLTNYPFPYYNDPATDQLTYVTNSGSDVVYNVYKNTDYKEYEDGTELILGPSRSQFQAGNDYHPQSFYYNANQSNNMFGGTIGYWNMTWLNNNNVDLEANSVKGQTNDFGILPTGTEILAFPANQYPNSLFIKVDAVFLKPLTSQQRNGLTLYKTENDIVLQYGNNVFLLGQANPLQNGLYQVRDTAWYKYTYIDQPSGSDNAGSIYGGPAVTLSAWWQGRGETKTYFEINIFVIGPTDLINITDPKLFKISPPWNVYSSGNVGISAYAEIILSDEQKTVIRNYKAAINEYQFLGVLFSHLPSGLVEGKTYYSIKNGVNIKFADSYQNAIDGVGVPLLTTGSGAMTIYTNVANEQRQLKRLDDGKETILEPNKIYYLINTYTGFQLADTKENAIAKNAIQLIVPPNTYLKALPNLQPPIKPPIVWNPANATDIEPLNRSEFPLISGENFIFNGNLLFKSRLSGGSYYSLPSRNENPSYKRNLTIGAGQLSGLIKPINWDVFFPKNDSLIPYNYIQMQRSTIGFIWSEPYNPQLYENRQANIATYTANGTTLTQQILTESFIENGWYRPRTFKNRLAGDNAFCVMIADKLNELIASQPITLLYQQSNNYTIDGGISYISGLYSQIIEYTLEFQASGTYDTTMYLTNVMAPGNAIFYTKTYNQADAINGKLIIGVKLGFGYNANTKTLTISPISSSQYVYFAANDAPTPTNYGLTTTSKNITYVANDSLGFNLTLSPSLGTTGAGAEIVFSESDYALPISKKVKLTFSDIVKHIWRKVTLSDETLITVATGGYGGYYRSDKAIEGTDYQEDASSVNSTILCTYDINRHIWASPALNSNGLKFKIEIALHETNFLTGYTGPTSQFLLRIKGSPNTQMLVPITFTRTTKIIKSGTLTKTYEVIELLIDDKYSGKIENNGYQLTILDPLYLPPKGHLAIDYKGSLSNVQSNVDQAFSTPLARWLPYKNHNDCWGRITRVEINYNWYGTYKAIPTATVVLGSGLNTANGSGAVLEVICTTSIDYFTKQTLYTPNSIKIINEGVNYWPKIPNGRLGDVVRVSGIKSDNTAVFYDFYFVTNNGNFQSWQYFPLTTNPTEAEVLVNFSMQGSIIYSANTLGLDGKGFITNPALGPVTLKSLKKIELIDP